MVSQYQYLGGYPGLQRANSASLGMGIHHHQYVMGEVAPDSYYAQPSSLEMTTSPTPMSQPDLFDFQVPPPQQPTPSFTLPERQHAAYARIERTVVSPIIPFTPPSSLPQSTTFEPSEGGESWVLEEGSEFVESEDEEEIPIQEMNGSNRNDTIGPLVPNNLHPSLNSYGTQARPFYSLAEDDVLVNYIPPPTDTPLNNPKTASIFLYFLNVTAPTINSFERNRPDPQRMFSNDSISQSQQHIWTCRSTYSSNDRDRPANVIRCLCCPSIAAPRPSSSHPCPWEPSDG